MQRWAPYLAVAALLLGEWGGPPWALFVTRDDKLGGPCGRGGAGLAVSSCTVLPPSVTQCTSRPERGGVLGPVRWHVLIAVHYRVGMG